jgi:two-component sensor histidine kinase
MTDFDFSINLPVRNEWKNVDLLRTSVQSCFIAVFADVDGCHALAMVTGELVENAVKYGDWSGNVRSFRLKVHGEANRAYVVVENPVKEDDPAVGKLLAMLARLQSYPNPELAYRARLLEVASQASPTDSDSGLGLVRVAYEAGATLSATVRNRVLRVIAEMPL